MKRLLVVAWLLLLAACASTPVDQDIADGLFADARFRPADTPIDANAVFALDDAMRRYLHSDIARQLRTDGARRGLFNALQSSGQLKLEYDAAFTRNAAEAFAARTGNCLSLVILTAALARELGLNVEFHEVLVEPTLSRSGDLVLYNGHVNVVLRASRGDDNTVSTDTSDLVIDFQPSEARGSQHVRTASERTVIAMYMNNRAAESLAAGRIDDAYWWARAALTTEPRYTHAYNTLGVVYRHHGDFAQAAATFDRALALEPANVVAMSNAIPVLRTLGRTREAEQWTRRLSALQPVAPFEFFEQGRSAMQAGDYARARALFEREIERAAYYHEFHFWLALAYVGLHQPVLARQHLLIARDNATTRTDATRYQLALDALEAQRAAAGGRRAYPHPHAHTGQTPPSH